MSSKIITGYFWDPDDADNKIFGQLTINPANDRYELKLNGLIKCVEGPLYHINYHEAIAVVHGYTSANDFISLFELRAEDYQNLRSASRSDDLARKSTLVTLRCKSYVLSSYQCFLPDATFSCYQLKFLPQFSDELDEGDNFTSNFAEVPLSDHDYLEKKGDTLTYTLQGKDHLPIPFLGGKLIFTGSFGELPLMPKNKLVIEKVYCFKLTLDQPVNFGEMMVLLGKMRSFFILMTGTYLELDHIRINTDGNYWHTFNAAFNKKNIYYPSGFPRNRMLYLQDISQEQHLNVFFALHKEIQLPLRHYLNFIQNDKEDPQQDLLTLIAAIEIMFNKTYNAANSQIGELSKVALELLALPGIKPHHREFMMNFRKGAKLKAFRIKDKLTKLIDDSEVLTRLVRDTALFTDQVLNARHYLVHEADFGDIELFHNELLLRKANMRLKIILEYYLLLYLKIPKETIEKRIYLILPNHVQFGN